MKNFPHQELTTEIYPCQREEELQTARQRCPMIQSHEELQHLSTRTTVLCQGLRGLKQILMNFMGEFTRKLDGLASNVEKISVRWQKPAGTWKGGKKIQKTAKGDIKIKKQSASRQKVSSPKSSEKAKGQ